MQYSTKGWKSYMQNVETPREMLPIVEMPLQELENMYPNIYFVLYPIVFQQCDMIDNTYGKMYLPNKGELSNIVEEVIEYMNNENTPMEPIQKDISSLQWDQNTTRDLISILLIRELIDRRRQGGYPPDRFGPGYGPGFGPGRRPIFGPRPGRGPGFGPPPGRGPGFYY